MHHHSIEEITIPTTLDEPEAVDFIASVHIRNTVETLGYGTDELSFSAAEILPRWLDPENVPLRAFGIRVGGTFVARAIYETRADATTAWLTVEVLPEHRNAGLGTALANHIESVAVADGRTNLLVYCVSAPGEGDHIVAPTGFGSVPRDNPEVRFLLDRGYSLEQVERGSRLAFPIDVPAVATRLAEVMPPGYRVHYWGNTTPERWREDFIVLLTRMSTDAPSAGLDEPEDPWTVDRLLTNEELAQASPRNSLVVAVEDVASARLVGFSELTVPAEPERLCEQIDTIVLREHRGNQLGTVLKLANLLNVHREYPGHPGIITFNAEENRHMLDVNESVGFVPIGYEGAWRKDIS